MKRVTAFFLTSVATVGVIAACGSGTPSGGSGFTTPPDASDVPPGTDATVPPVDSGTGPTFGHDSGKSDNSDGAVATVSCPNPNTCLSLGITCGAAGDGCGDTIQCGTCTAPQACGGGGVASNCGDSTPCVPKACTDLNATCGQQGDGCGHVIQCGTCTLPATCGGGGTPNQCGQAATTGDSGTPVSCTKATCASANANCGQVSDNCGGLTASCGTCATPAICGGGGVPNVCGDSNLGDGGAGTCTNLCLQIPTTCAAGVTTTISGTVVAPTVPVAAKGKTAAITPDPLYGALVYIPNSPNGALDPFPTKVSCDQCGAEASGSPLVSATTGADGKFVLSGVPAGTNIPIVYQLGRWRREVTIPVVNPCVDNPLTTDQTRFARKQNEGSPYDNIPLTAMVTGSVDALECVLRKIGVDDTQFGDPTTPASGTGTPRIQIFTGEPSKNSDAVGGASYDGKTPGESSLWSSATTLEQYDQVLFACQGGADTRTATALANVQAYANLGGRVYATHYSYDWIFTNSPWDQTANWSDPDDVNDWPSDPTPAFVDTANFPKGQAFAQWLVYSGASTTAGQVPISAPRGDVLPPFANGAQEWIYATNPNTDSPLHYTFDTPTTSPPAQQCGRVLYSDFHVTNDSTGTFPAECDLKKMTAQEKVLEFMIFDLASCIPGNPVPPPATCTPLTCAQQNLQCGPAGDGCGHIIQCPNCPSGQACGAGGPSTCGPVNNPCTPLTCPAATDAGAACGPMGDGCGNLLDCGACSGTQTCGGGGVANQCGSPPCVPAKCTAAQTCGTVADGCGGTADCGTCTPPETCGGTGVANQCGYNGVK